MTTQKTPGSQRWVLLVVASLLVMTAFGKALLMLAVSLAGLLIASIVLLRNYAWTAIGGTLFAAVAVSALTGLAIHFAGG